MNVRIFWVHAMECQCMCAQTKPERVSGEQSQDQCWLQGKNLLYRRLRGGSNHAASWRTVSPTHYQLSYSGSWDFNLERISSNIFLLCTPTVQILVCTQNRQVFKSAVHIFHILKSTNQAWENSGLENLFLGGQDAGNLHNIYHLISLNMLI